jgi:DNA polymerase-3 subunit epsilon
MIDVQNIFMRMEQRTLSAAYQFYLKKPLVNAHTALADANATYEILQQQLEYYMDAEFIDKDGSVSKPVVNDVNSLAEFSTFNKNADLNGQIVLDDQGIEIFNFGKHKGISVQKVFELEPQYYDWMMKADFPRYTKKILTAIKLRGFNSGSTKAK